MHVPALRPAKGDSEVKSCPVILPLVLCCGLQSAAHAELDRSLMSDAYWKIWNDAEQARIDADIEAAAKHWYMKHRTIVKRAAA